MSTPRSTGLELFTPPISKRPTMRDVANLAGVGVATVSRVVNNKGSVNEDKEARVRRAIAALNFEPDEIARSLRPGQVSKTIGLNLGDLTNPFWSHLCKGAVDEARAAGYAIIVGTSDEDQAEERRALSDLLSRRIAGLVLSPDARGNAILLDELGALRVPTVFVDRPSRDVQADFVVLDNQAGGYLATRNLIESGHKRIAAIVAPSYYSTGLRTRGYRQALREAGIEVPDRYVVKLKYGSPDDAAKAVLELLKLPDPPTAFFSTTNFLTQGIIKALGGDLGGNALVGFDDFDLSAALPVPISVVASDTEQMGREAVRMLLERIEGYSGVARREVLPVELVKRQSGELKPRS